MPPEGAREAKAIGFIDDCFGGTVAEFEDVLIDKAKQLARSANFWLLLREKHEKRLADERAKPLAAYRGEELKHMEVNFFGEDPGYHLARERLCTRAKRARAAARGRAPSRFGKQGKAIAGDRSFSGG